MRALELRAGRDARWAHRAGLRHLRRLRQPTRSA